MSSPLGPELTVSSLLGGGSRVAGQLRRSCLTGGAGRKDRRSWAQGSRGRKGQKQVAVVGHLSGQVQGVDKTCPGVPPSLWVRHRGPRGLLLAGEDGFRESVWLKRVSGEEDVSNLPLDFIYFCARERERE